MIKRSDQPDFKVEFSFEARISLLFQQPELMVGCADIGTKQIRLNYR